MSDPTPVQIQFGTQVADHASGALSHELAENLYFEKAPQGAKSPYILLGTPGLDAFTQPGSGHVRGLIAMGAYIFAVIGETLYMVDEAGVSTTIGAVAGTETVRMAENGTHVWIAADEKLYAANATSIIELPEGNMVGVAYQDGYMIGAQGGGQLWWISGLDDATTIGALDFTSADALPGELVGCISDHREPLMFKTSSIEAYYNSGAAAFPFTRTQVIERGCLAPASIAKADNKVFWLGNDLLVYEMAGYQPNPISTTTVTRKIQAQSSPQTAVGWTYQQDGHTHYVLSFSDLTIVYDLTTGLWHKRVSDGLNRWRVSAHVWVDAWKKHIVGDYSTGDLYYLDTATYDENGSVLRRRATGQGLWNNGLHQIVDEFMLDIDTGVGLVTGQGSDPNVVLDWSSDGGRTWSSELWRSFGAIGLYDLPVRWHNLGRHRQWTPRITISDPVPVRISGAYVRRERLAA